MAPPLNQSAVSLTGAIMVAAVVIIFFIFVFFLILYIRYNLYLGTNRSIASSPAHFAGGTATAVFSRGLHPAVLKSLPVSVFTSTDVKETVECTVCLTEISNGELFRQLPVCRHGFHLECIDLWFNSNSTCPICRSSVDLPKKGIFSSAEESPTANNRGLKEYCLGEGSSRIPGRVLAVEIPIDANDSPFSQYSGGIPPLEEVKSPNLATESLPGLVNLGSGEVRSGCCSREWDIEQGRPPRQPLTPPHSMASSVAAVREESL